MSESRLIWTINSLTQYVSLSSWIDDEGEDEDDDQEEQQEEETEMEAEEQPIYDAPDVQIGEAMSEGAPEMDDSNTLEEGSDLQPLRKEKSRKRKARNESDRKKGKKKKKKKKRR